MFEEEQSLKENPATPLKDEPWPKEESMKVRKLIELLSEYNPEAEIKVVISNYPYPI